MLCSRNSTFINRSIKSKKLLCLLIENFLSEVTLRCRTSNFEVFTLVCSYRNPDNGRIWIISVPEEHFCNIVVFVEVEIFALRTSFIYITMGLKALRIVNLVSIPYTISHLDTNNNRFSVVLTSCETRYNMLSR